MECLTILTLQQNDFYERIKSGHLLYCDLNYLFSELVIIPEERLKEIKNHCGNIVVKYQSTYPKIDLFNNSLKNGLISYCIEQIYEDFTQALKLNPCLAQGYYNRAIVYSDLGEVEEAIKDYKLAIKLMPNYGKAYYNLALLLADLGKYEQALNYYKHISKIDPNFYQADYNKESLVKYLNHNIKLNCDDNNKVKVRHKKVVKYDKIKIEKSSDIIAENIPNHELIKLDRSEIKQIENKKYITKSKKSIERKIIDTWNTKQY